MSARSRFVPFRRFRRWFCLSDEKEKNYVYILIEV